MKLSNPEIRIENTSFCNTHCIICPRDKMTRPKATMPYDHFKDLVLEGKNLGAELVSIFGYGEPLMDSMINKKVRLCTMLGLDTFITTNGALLGVDIGHELIEAGLTRLRLSAHGIFDNYEKVHKLDFMKVMRNFFNFIKQSRGRVFIDVVAIPMNGEPVDDIVNFWEGKVDSINVWKPHGWGGKKNYRKGRKRIKTCGRPFTGPVQIQADGKVIPCCFLTDGEVILGDTYIDSIEDILKGDKFNEFRRKHEVEDFDGLPCQECDQRFVLDESPLLYSSDDMSVNKTSSNKFKLLEEENGVNAN